MDIENQIGPCEHKVIVAALMFVAAEVRSREMVLLNRGPHRAIQHENPLSKRFQKKPATIVLIYHSA